MNLQNIIHLIKRYFIESGKKDINSFLLIILVIVLFGLFSISGGVGDSMMFTLLLVMGTVYAARIFGIFQPANKAIHYLTIPASTAEKTVANGFLVFIYYNVVLIFSLIIGDVIGGLAHKLLNPTYYYVFHMPFSLGNLITILLLESVFMFGSIYFKTRPFIKTALVIIGIFIFFFILNTSLLGSFVIRHNPQTLKDLNDSFYDINIELIEYTVSFLIFAFFNIMTWLRLRETEA